MFIDSYVNFFKDFESYKFSKVFYTFKHSMVQRTLVYSTLKLTFRIQKLALENWLKE